MYVCYKSLKGSEIGTVLIKKKKKKHYQLNACYSLIWQAIRKINKYITLS